jgi:hypothetical protein
LASDIFVRNRAVRGTFSELVSWGGGKGEWVEDSVEMKEERNWRGNMESECGKGQRRG